MKGRQAPPIDPQEEARRRALLSLDVPTLRAWMKLSDMSDYSADDALVLRAAHEVRVVDTRLPLSAQLDSLIWLRANHPESDTLKTIAAYPREFRVLLRAEKRQ